MTELMRDQNSDCATILKNGGGEDTLSGLPAFFLGRQRPRGPDNGRDSRPVRPSHAIAAAEQSIARLIEAATRIDAPFWQTAGQFLSGKLMIERGEFAQGVAVLNDAFDACRRTGRRMSYPEFKGALATGLAGLGQLDAALAAVNEGLDGALQGEHGYDLFFAELLRIKGEILLRREAVTAAEDRSAQALNIARQQEALLWELRAALSLARLRATQGRGGEARQLLAPVYDRFTEGFETPDLRAAKAFLDEPGPDPAFVSPDPK